MPANDGHLSDREMLLAVDGECSPRQGAGVRKHLAACWKCRARMGEIERTISDFVRLRRDLGPHLPAADGPRAQLKAQLSELARTARIRRGFGLFRSLVHAHSVAYVCAILCLLVLVAAGLALQRRNSRYPGAPTFSQVESASIPKRSLTPGAVRPVAINDVCGEQRDETVRAVPISIQRKVFQEYGMANARPSDYEVDYLITPELGGVEDIRNLWPEPHSSTEWNSYVKDDLESYLHQQVCLGKLDLRTAQRDIATDWISAYKKYFHSDRPLSDHLAPALSDERGPTT
jgi:hypothetical protein